MSKYSKHSLNQSRGIKYYHRSEKIDRGKVGVFKIDKKKYLVRVNKKITDCNGVARTRIVTLSMHDNIDDAYKSFENYKIKK